MKASKPKVLKALNIAAMDALVAGVVALVMVTLYAWATKQGSTISEESYSKPFVLGMTLRTVFLGVVVGGIFASIIRPSWGPFAPVIGSIGFLGILENQPDFPRVVFILGLALIFGLVGFSHNMSAERAETVKAEISEGRAAGNATAPLAPPQEKTDPGGSEKPED